MAHTLDPSLLKTANKTALRASYDGFSLLELMIVIVIISITFTFALLSFGDFGVKRRLIVATEQFINVIELAQQHSILEAKTLGIQFQQQHYQIVRFKEPNHWKLLSSRNSLQNLSFPKDTQIEWQNIRNKSPAIILYPSGEMTGFKLRIGSKKHPNLITVSGLNDGTITYNITQT